VLPLREINWIDDDDDDYDDYDAMCDMRVAYLTSKNIMHILVGNV